jgi:glycosyltransferase involved in cell wall biosynthesis
VKRIGVFLGVVPGAGGMFQYAQCILDALNALPRHAYAVTAAYVDPLWRRYLDQYPFERLQIVSGALGLRLAGLLMATGLPGSMCRRISSVVNPVARVLARAEADLWVFPAQDAISYQFRGASLCTIHDLMHRYEKEFPEVSAWGRFAIRERRFRGIVEWAAGVLVDSECGAQQVVDSYGVTPAKIFPLPYVASRVDVGRADGDLVSRYGLPGKYFFYPAQFWAHKNHVRLLEALSQVRTDCPDVHLVLCGGKKNGFRNVQRAIRNLGLETAVTLMGYVPDADMPGLYRRARALVMPTFFGPTNIPPLEAFKSGCPVAVSDIYGMREQVDDAAILFDPKSVGDIVRSMRRLWCDDQLCSDLIRRGYRRVSEWGPEEFNDRFRVIVSELTQGP